MMGRPRLLSNFDVSRAKALVRSGSTHASAARLLNVSPTTIRRALHAQYRQPERRW